MRRLLIAFTLAIMMCGCSLFEHPDVTCPDDGQSEGVTMSFRMLTSSSIMLSRSDNEGHDEFESEFKQFEDGIDMNDLGLFVFVGTGDDAPLLLKTTDIGHSNDPLMTVTGSPGAYTVTMFFTHEQMAEKLGYNLDPNSDDDLTFRILIVANSNSPGTSGAGKWNQINGETLEDVIGQLNAWKFGMNYIYNKNYEGEEVNGLYPNQKKNIPMFGLNTFTVTQSELYYSRPDDRVYLGEISMLRAVAKVRVVDNIADKDADGYPRIVGAEFIGSQDEVRPLPYDAINYKDGYQVHTANIYAPDNTLSPEGESANFRLGTVPDSWNITPESQRKGQTFIGYVPEQKIDNINNDVRQGMPVLRLKVIKEKPEGIPAQPQIYDVPMTGYKDNVFHFGVGENKSILRNHIYTLSVDNVSSATASITVVVDEWVPEDPQYLDYTETVRSTPIKWTPGCYDDIDETGNVIMKPWKTVQDASYSVCTPLEFTFTIDSPRGATWAAYLVPLEGNPNNFYISYPWTGTVDGEPVTLEIFNNDEESSMLHRARLQILVTLGSGNVYEVRQTPTEKDFSNYIIVQNPVEVNN